MLAKKCGLRCNSGAFNVREATIFGDGHSSLRNTISTPAVAPPVPSLASQLPARGREVNRECVLYANVLLVTTARPRVRRGSYEG